MTDEGMNKLKDLRKEYEFLAKYNGGEDYIAFKALDMVIKELSAPEESAREWCKQNGYVMMRESDYGQAVTKAYFDGQNAEPCEDAISRQAVLVGIEELKKSPWATDKRGNGFEYLIKEALEVVADLCVKKEPSVTPKQKMGWWIPVSERFPEKEGRYLTTIFNGIRYIMTCEYSSFSNCWFPDDECASDNVIAWMPLPEPYKAESEETE